MKFVCLMLCMVSISFTASAANLAAMDAAYKHVEEMVFKDAIARTSIYGSEEDHARILATWKKHSTYDVVRSECKEIGNQFYECKVLIGKEGTLNPITCTFTVYQVLLNENNQVETTRLRHYSTYKKKDQGFFGDKSSCLATRPDLFN